MPSPIAAISSIAQVAGSGTGENDSMPAVGPPANGAMVILEPIPRVKVPMLIESTVRLVVLSTPSAPAPVTA